MQGPGGLRALLPGLLSLCFFTLFVSLCAYVIGITLFPSLSLLSVYLSLWSVSGLSCVCLSVRLSLTLSFVFILVQVTPKFGRLALFQGRIPHAARPPSVGRAGPRYSFAVKLSVNKEVAKEKGPEGSPQRGMPEDDEEEESY